MLIRQVVGDLVALGRMPDEDAEEEAIERWANTLKAIPPPLTDHEAVELAKCFPPDMGYGLGFSLLHLLETAPGWADALAGSINDREWRERAQRRIRNATKGA